MKTGVADSFLDKLKAEIDDNLTNDQFSVEQLAKRVGMSRSQLHRKLTSVTGQSVSQFIREHRLTLGMALLKGGDLTAAEVADKIGFGSPTYFSKCFNEYYGFPPGEVKNMLSDGQPLHESAPQPIPQREVTGKSLSWVKVISIGAIIIAVGILFYFFSARLQINTGAKGKSIAILPFKNLSEDPSNEYFSEGVVEAIRTTLSQVGDIEVISRTSVEQYRKTEKSAKDIAEELNVSALLEGSIQRNNNAVRVEVRLVDGYSEGQVWAKTFDRELKDVFAIQSEIAQQVAEALHAKLSPEEKSKLSATETKNSKAYDLYLKGVYEFRTYTNKGTHNAIDLLTQAVALDSNYARAYAYLAYSHICLASIFGAEHSALQGLNNGKPFIDKALAIEPDLDIAHMLMGFYYVYHDWDSKKAEASYKKAIVSDDPDALAMWCDYLNFTRRHKEALVVAEHLNTVDPYYPNSRMILSYHFNHMYDEALAFSNTRLKLFNNYYSLDSHGFLLLQVGRYAEAVTYFNKAIALEGIRYPRMLGWTGAAYAKAGQRQKAVKVLDELKARLSRGENGSIAFFIAVIYAALDDKKSAVEWITMAYNSHDMEMPWIMTEPQFVKLHNEPAFQSIAKKVGF
ncbi:MAG: helix-turn-helix domain-containing protein [Chryseolinea sp.]